MSVGSHSFQILLGFGGATSVPSTSCWAMVVDAGNNDDGDERTRSPLRCFRVELVSTCIIWPVARVGARTAVTAGLLDFASFLPLFSLMLDEFGRAEPVLTIDLRPSSETKKSIKTNIWHLSWQ